MLQIVRWTGLALAAVVSAIVLYRILEFTDRHFGLALLDREHGCYLDVIGIYCKGFPGARIVTDVLNFLYLLFLAVPTVLLMGLLSVLVTGTLPSLTTDAATTSFLAAAITWFIALIAAAFWVVARAIRWLRSPEARD